MGISFLLSPVLYSYKFAYDLRGITKWIASSIAIITGIYSLYTAIEKGEFVKYYCPECGKSAKIKEDTTVKCPFCKIPLRKL